MFKWFWTIFSLGAPDKLGRGKDFPILISGKIDRGSAPREITCLSNLHQPNLADKYSKSACWKWDQELKQTRYLNEGLLYNKLWSTIFVPHDISWGKNGGKKISFYQLCWISADIFGHRGGTKTICACCKGFCKGASRKVNKVYSNDASEFMIKVHQLLQNNGGDPTA